MEKNNSFLDNKVRAALENFEVPYNDDHWQQMLTDLKAFELAEKAEDEALRNKIGDSQSGFPTANWDLMAQRLNETDAEEVAKDKLIRQKIENETPQYRAANWDLMNEKLEEEFSWKRRIVRFKVVEMAMMMLVLFTVFNVMDFSESAILSPNTEGGKTADINPAKNQKDLKANSLKKIVQNETQSPLNPSLSNKNLTNNSDFISKNINNLGENPAFDAVKQDVATADLNENLNKNIEPATDLNSNSINSNVVAENKLPENGFQNVEIKANTKGDVPTNIPSKLATELAVSSVEKTGDVSDELNNVLGKKSIVADAPFVNILRPNALTINDLYDEPLIPAAKKKTKWWRLNIFGSSAVDVVKSDYVYRSGYKEDAAIVPSNLGGGVLTGYKFGKLELESGLAYKSKTYKPIAVDITSGTIGANNLGTFRTPDEVKLDLVSVPLNLNYHVKESRRWDFLTSVGIAFNAAAKILTVYSQKESDNRRTLASLSGTRSANDVTDIGNYGNGFLKDGSLKDNYFLTAQLGIGLEYKVTPLWNLFLQSNFEQQFGQPGIGTRSDRFSSFSLHGGVKVKVSGERY